MNRFELASFWRAEGRFWTRVIFVCGAVAVALIPVQFAVADAFWSGVIVGLGILAIIAQLSAFVPMVISYRRAAKVRRE